MKIKTSSRLLLPVILIIGCSVNAQEYFETVSQAYEHIFVAVIEWGDVVRLGADVESVECGNRYEAIIRKSAKGKLDTSRFTFFSTKRLTVGQSYLVYYSPTDAKSNRLSPSDTADIVKCRSRMKGPLLTFKELHEITESWNGTSTDLVVEIDDVWAEYENIAVQRQERVLAKLDDVLHALIDAEKKH